MVIEILLLQYLLVNIDFTTTVMTIMLLELNKDLNLLDFI